MAPHSGTPCNPTGLPVGINEAFETELMAAGIDVGIVAKLMGHSLPTMLLTHYQYVMDKKKGGGGIAPPTALYDRPV